MNTKPRSALHVVVATLALAASTAACAPSGQGSTPPGAPESPGPAAQELTVAVSPQTATIPALSQQAFAATVTGTGVTAVTWSVSEGSAGGSVSATGLYTAPATAGTYHVVVKSSADPTKTATAVVTVTAAPPPPPPVPITVAISPATGAAVYACQSLTFTATVTGTTSTGVTWSVAEANGGGVTAAGVFTAPAAGGTYHVVATSKADATRQASVAVTVTEKVLSVAVAPTSATVTTGGTVQLTANVTTTCGTSQAMVAAVP